MTDSFEQYRHELMRKLAYEYWERRGRPFGSSEVDWSAAEKAIDPYLLASGQEFPSLEIRPEPDEGSVWLQRIETHPDSRILKINPTHWPIGPQSSWL
jgi:Protein of unknown function (DUF2934)